MITLRPYQEEAVNAVYEYMRTQDGNPCVVLPVGTGKSICLAKIVQDAVMQWNSRVVLLAHVKELLEQNADKIRKLCPEIPVGVYSAGLKSRDTNNPVIVAGIQSVYNKADQLGAFDLALIDECFPAGTLVDTPRGALPIEELCVGQPVYNAKGIGKIEAISCRPAKQLVEVTISNGTKIRCTPNHRFFTGKRWCKAGSLPIGADLFSRDDMITGHPCGLKVIGVADIQPRRDYVHLVYNLQVSGSPTYYADGVLVHNCHLIPTDGIGQYRTFLHDMQIINPKFRIVGFTATPYRLKGGPICQPDHFINGICYEAGLKEMIQQGYLSPLVSKAGRAEAQLDNLHIRAGEFIAEEVEAAMDVAEITDAACREIVEKTADRKAVLIFASSVKHCYHIAEKITSLTGMECPVVSGETPAAERAEIIERIRGKRIQKNLLGETLPPLKYLCNMNVLTTGFDAPNIDCVVLLRATASPGLLMQMVGRGIRLADSKGSCLVLDFGGNILRHGPLDCLTVRNVTSPRKGNAPVKKCPECFELVEVSYSICPSCGYHFEPQERKFDKLTSRSSSEALLSGESVITDYEVEHVDYSVHKKRGAGDDVPKTMQIDYSIGYYQIKSEWVCPEHSGYARSKFETWWNKRAALGCPMPLNAESAVALAKAGLLAEPTQISVKTVAGEKFDRIVAWKLGPRPVMREPGEDYEEDYPSNSPSDLGVVKDDLDEIPF